MQHFSCRKGGSCGEEESLPERLYGLALLDLSLGLAGLFRSFRLLLDKKKWAGPLLVTRPNKKNNNDNNNRGKEIKTQINNKNSNNKNKLKTIVKRNNIMNTRLIKKTRHLFSPHTTFKYEKTNTKHKLYEIKRVRNII